MSVEITAANKSNVCTYAVTKDELDQPVSTYTYTGKISLCNVGADIHKTKPSH